MRRYWRGSWSAGGAATGTAPRAEAWCSPSGPLVPRRVTRWAIATAGWSWAPAMTEAPLGPSVALVLQRRPERKRLRDRFLAICRAVLLLDEVVGLTDVPGVPYHVRVRGSSGGRYLVEWGTVANVVRVDEYGHRYWHLCALPVGDLPTGDVVLAQVMRLETDEAGFCRIAKRFPCLWDLHAERAASYRD